MSLREQMMADLKEAMKSKDQAKMDAIRFLQSAIKNREIDLRPAAITETDIQGVLKKMAKQRRESIEQYEKAGRQDLVDKETAELALVEHYLPQQMSAEMVGKVVQEVITALGATTIKQMGAVIKEVQARTKGTADNKLVSELVKSRLT
jgi:uncharacterized protein YqeY